MEKILLAIDATHPDKKALDFACYLGRLTKSKITGVFLENAVAEEKPVLERLHTMSNYLEWEVEKVSAAHKEKMNIIEQHIAYFKEACNCREVNFNIRRNDGIPTDELLEESRFADLIVVDAETSFNKHFEGTPTAFVRALLKDAECPVVIAPEHFDEINELVFTYNGSASSVFAIKQFTYLFPQLSHIKTTVVYVSEDGNWNGRDKVNVYEWLKEHYRDLHFELLKGNADDVLLGYLLRRKNTFLVMGAYGRNALSQFFRPSHANRLIKATNLPLFITHV